MEEIWKDITGYEGLYQVSSSGRIKSLNYGKERILKPYDLKGYKRIGLFRNGKRKHILIHRLVAGTFIPNPDNLPQINHKDENTSNNRVENLEWCDAKYNNNYGTHCSKLSNIMSGREPTWLTKTVLQYTKDGIFVKEYKSTRECGRNGFDQSAVSACCLGKIQKYKNFIWKFKNV